MDQEISPSTVPYYDRPLPTVRLSEPPRFVSVSWQQRCRGKSEVGGERCSTSLLLRLHHICGLMWIRIKKSQSTIHESLPVLSWIRENVLSARCPLYSYRYRTHHEQLANDKNYLSYCDFPKSCERGSQLPELFFFFFGARLRKRVHQGPY